MQVTESTRARALREAGALLQARGFNGFSFQHVADRLGIKKPSLYAHFKSKEELGRELIEEYRRSFIRWAETIEALEPRDKIGALFDLFYRMSAKSGGFCPLSAMISDLDTLPQSIKKPLRQLFHYQRDWTRKVIAEGQKKKKFSRTYASDVLAGTVMSIGFGAQAVARASEDPQFIKKMREQALDLLEV